MSLAYLAVGVIFCFCLVTRIVHRSKTDVWRLPGPHSCFANWLWGHEKYAFDHDTFSTYEKWALEFGPVYKFRAALFHSSVVVVADHAAAHHVFQQHDDFVKATQIRALMSKASGDSSILIQQRDAWRRVRRLIAPAFSAIALKDSFVDIVDCVGRLERTLTSLVTAGNGQAVVNISARVSICALDVIGRTSFGHDFQEGKTPEAKAILNAWNARVAGERSFQFQIIGYIFRAFPFLVSLPIPIMKDAMVLRTIVSKICMDMLKSGDFSEKSRDALGILVRASDEFGGDKLTHEELVDNMTLLLIAGSETTAGTTTFTLLDLARNPAVQDRLRQEVRAAGRELTYDNILKLKYLDAVVKEGLRLHPATTSTERIATQDCAIPLSAPVYTTGNQVLSFLRVKAGQLLYIPYKTIHLNPDVWGSNATRFVPERWITPGGMPSMSELPYGWSGLVSFADGPRLCIGYRLALLEMKVILATLIRTFEFRESEGNIKELVKPTVQAVTNDSVGVLPLKISLAA